MFLDRFTKSPAIDSTADNQSLDKLPMDSLLEDRVPDYVVVVRRRVKWARIEVKPDGSVCMVVPRLMTQGEIKSFFNRKRGWVEQKRRLFAERAAAKPPSNEIRLFGEVYRFLHDPQASRPHVCRESRTVTHHRQLTKPQELSDWHRQYSKEYLSNRINEISEITGLRFNKIYIREQKTRWGSCSNKKNISLNWRLIKAPTCIIDYVIYHELAHTLEMNHSSRFWDLVEQHQPTYKKHRSWLKENGHLL